MKKKNIIATFILLMVFSMTGCSGLDEQSQQCLNDLKTGLQNRWDIVNNDYNSYEEYIEETTKGINAELEMLNSYANTVFEDEEFSSLISSYIDALDSQKEGIACILTDSEKYYSLYYEKGLTVESECINTLSEKYGFKVDSEYKDDYDSLLNDSSLKIVAPNQKMEVTTEYGKYEIIIIGAAETEWDKSGYEGDLTDNDESTYPATIRCEINNISYSGLYEGKICGYDLSSDGSMLVMDSEGYNLEFYDIAGPSDGEYEVSADTPIGSKARVSYPYVVPNDESQLTIVIGGTYKIFVNVDRENIVGNF